MVMFRKESDSGFKCDCWTCRKSRVKLNQLSKEENALSYHMVKILKELLGGGNF